MNALLDFVRSQSRLLDEAARLPLAATPIPDRPRPAPDAPRTLIFSPHPDDECIVGGLALRLQREAGWHVVNVAVTQGSRRDRQATRRVELSAACRYLGFELQCLGENGLENVTARARSEDPRGWAAKVDAIEATLREHQPRVLFFPHDQDWNGTHIGVHLLVMDALARIGAAADFHLVETEFWGQNYRPNLLVESTVEEVAELITALTFHVGEVERNPYHLTLPSWMVNNVRLGGETVGGQGAAPPRFHYGTVYRLRAWRAGQVVDLYAGGRIVPAGEPVATLFG